MSAQRMSRLAGNGLALDREMLIGAVRGLKEDPAFEPETAMRALKTLVPGLPDEHPLDRFMTWDHAREMSRGGVTFGVHGHSHQMMTRLPVEAVAAELGTAQARLTRELGRPATSASYPNGNWNAEVAACARAAGLTTAFTMDRGHAAATSNPHAMPRMNIHEGLTRSEPMFLARILGVF